MIDPNHLIQDLTTELDCVMITLDIVTTDRLRTMMLMTAEILILTTVVVERNDEITDDGDMTLLQVTIVTTTTVHPTEII